MEVGRGGQMRIQETRIYIAHAADAEILISGKSHLGFGGRGRKVRRDSFWKVKQ